MPTAATCMRKLMMTLAAPGRDHCGTRDPPLVFRARARPRGGAEALREDVQGIVSAPTAAHGAAKKASMGPAAREVLREGRRDVTARALVMTSTTTRTCSRKLVMTSTAKCSRKLAVTQMAKGSRSSRALVMTSTAKCSRALLKISTAGLPGDLAVRPAAPAARRGRALHVVAQDGAAQLALYAE